MPSEDPAPGAGTQWDTWSGKPDALERAIQELTRVLLAVARGDFAVRAERDYSGDAIDVLAFLVNSTADEVGELVRALQEEQEMLQRARDQLVLNAKLAALGKLSAGVAHELNQPLTAIQLLLDIVREKSDQRIGDHDAHFQTMSEAIGRMGRIVASVRAFGRSGALQLEPVPADQPLLGAIELLDESFQRHRIRAQCLLPERLPEITADADGLHQVFVNLLSNARDALAGSDREDTRQVIVEVGVTSDAVIYSVQDNGPGIPPAIVSRIFDPFFTTKEVGQGTGLGLSVSHGIVADHGGHLRHEDVPGGGARFVVELPLHGRPAADQPG